MWGIARAFGGEVLLRIEDHDRTRSRPEFEDALVEDLNWLGFFPDAAISRQSEHEDRYEAALRELAQRELVYACDCSRTLIASMAGPVRGEVPYPGTCRHKSVDGDVERARRIRLEPMRVDFSDLRLGVLQQVPSEQAGDILARDRSLNWTYQFAVAVDDLTEGIDLVIRGEDLIESTGRQIQLAKLLGRKTPPMFLHHPLITHPSGEKLSKSNRDTGVADLRAAGWSVERVLGRASQALGLSDGSTRTFSQVITSLKDSPRA